PDDDLAALGQDAVTRRPQMLGGGQLVGRPVAHRFGPFHSDCHGSHLLLSPRRGVRESPGVTTPGGGTKSIDRSPEGATELGPATEWVALSGLRMLWGTGDQGLTPLRGGTNAVAVRVTSNRPWLVHPRDPGACGHHREVALEVRRHRRAAGREIDPLQERSSLRVE